MEFKVPLSLAHLVVSPSGRYAGLLGRTGHARLLDLETGKKRWDHRLSGSDGRHQALNERVWVVSCNRRVHIFDIDSGEMTGVVEAHARERTLTPVVAIDARDTVWVPEGSELVGYAPDGVVRERRAVHERGGTSTWLLAAHDEDAQLLFSSNPIANELVFLLEPSGTRALSVPYDYVPGEQNYETRAWLVGDRIAALRKSRGLTWFDRETLEQIAHTGWEELRLAMYGARLSLDGRWLLGMDTDVPRQVTAVRVEDGYRLALGEADEHGPPSFAFDDKGTLYLRETRRDGRKRSHSLRSFELPQAPQRARIPQ